MEKLLYWTTIIILLAKILGLFPYSWWWILAPLLIYITVYIIAILLVGIGFLFVFANESYKEWKLKFKKKK